MTNEEHIEQLKKLRSFHNGSYGRSINKAIEALNQQKEGHWIRWYEVVEDEGCKDHIPHCMCSECSKEQLPLFSKTINYCPNCGAKMVEPQESEG